MGPRRKTQKPYAKAAAVDFDGTLCIQTFPQIGKPKYRIIRRCKRLQAKGWIIILWTCREDKLLTEAIQACHSWGFYPDYINCNDPFRVAYFHTDPRKIGADLYIDDLSFNPIRRFFWILLHAQKS